MLDCNYLSCGKVTSFEVEERKVLYLGQVHGESYDAMTFFLFAKLKENFEFL